MYSKKYRITSVEEIDGYNFMHDGMEGKICYPAYLKVGERGWFLYDTEDWCNPVHRIHTSPIEDVKYTDNQIIVKTENTVYTFTVEE